jgi:hypothetical protein
MTLSLKQIGQKLFGLYLGFVGIWLLFALSFDVFMIFIHFTNEDLSREISNEISWKIDGTFKNNPNNIWYEGPVTK